MSARLLCVVLGLAACGPRDIVVVELPPAPDGGFLEPGPPCAADSECVLPMSYCDKPSCGATLGNCRRKDTACEATLAPVCGCNGVNYWNECYRRSQGIASSTAGECATPATCTSAAGCPGFGAACAQLLPAASNCSAVPSGVCWVLPVTCPPGDGAWESCAGAPVCEGLCAAIRSGAARQQVNSCP